MEESNWAPFPCIILFSRLYKPSFPPRSLIIMCTRPPNHLSGPMLHYLQFISICLELGGSKTGHSTPDAVFKCRHLKVTSLSLLLLVQLTSICDCQSSLLTYVQLPVVLPSGPQVLFGELIPSHLDVGRQYCMALFCPRCEILHLTSLSLMRFVRPFL